MMKLAKVALAALVVWLSTGTAVAGKLFSNGKSRYAIVLAKDASPSEQTAAEELQSYLEQISGAKLELLSDDNAADHRKVIYVGYSEKYGVKTGIERPKDGDESFTYRTVGDDLWIYGGKQRGTMYGVYAFLENELGVRWYTPKCTYVPELESYTLKKLNHSESPYIGIRFTDYNEAQVDDFQAHNKLNSRWGVVHNKYGGLNGYWGAHTFGWFVPEGVYFTEHPEYFSLRDGERQTNSQLCLTNPEVLELCKQAMKRAIEENPDYWVYSLSQNDNQFYCQCEKCQAKAAEYGGQSGLLLWFVNQVADYIKEYHPEKYISTFAYTYTRGVPKNIVPRDNVVIRLCSIECCFAHPLSECEHNKPFMHDLKAWSKIAPKLYIWDYVVNFRQYLAPFPNFYVLADNIKTYKEHRVVGILEQSVYNSTGSAFAELKTWVIAKLLWNPELDTKALVEEFIANYYGAAAEYVQQYFDLCHAQIKDDYMNIYFSEQHPIYSEEFISEATELVDKARKAVENESDEMKHRVDLVRLQMQYLHLMRHPQQAGEDGTRDYVFDFLRKHNILPFEWTDTETWIKIYKMFYLGEKHDIVLPPHLLHLLNYVDKEFAF